MKRLIEDLLTLARIGRAAEQQEQVPLGDLMAELVRDFEFTLNQRNARIEYPNDLPVARYNRTHLGMVFRNLISNGLKFNTNPSPTASIKVEESGDCHVVSVTDNGIGIEREDFDRIFGIFTRAVPREQFEGTGAGLAIVRNIVEHHRGRIWLESTPGKGTTFFFSIPK